MELVSVFTISLAQIDYYCNVALIFYCLFPLVPPHFRTRVRAQFFSFFLSLLPIPLLPILFCAVPPLFFFLSPFSLFLFGIGHGTKKDKDRARGVVDAFWGLGHPLKHPPSPQLPPVTLLTKYQGAKREFGVSSGSGLVFEYLTQKNNRILRPAPNLTPNLNP